MEIAEIIAKVQSFAAARHVVLTGGEPMVAKGMGELAAELKRLKYHLTLETAATIAPDGIACDLASLSPKLSNSAPDKRLSDSWREKHDALRWQPDVVRQWISNSDYQFKFVMAEESDVAEMEMMLADLKVDIPKHKIMLMPEGVSMEVLRKRASWLAELCKARGYRYAHRLQIELYGDTRGT